MKTAIIMLTAFAGAASPVAAVTGASVTLYANLSPTRIPNVHGTVVGGVVPDYILTSPSFDAYSANVIAALEAEQTSRGGSIDTTPTAFNTLTRTTFNAGETFATPFHSWRGDLVPTGAFAGEYGTFLRLATRIVSPTVFTLADVVESDTDTPDLPTVFTSTFADQIKAYGLTAVGINYGADGKLGGGDDIVYNSAGVDPATTPINELDYIGSANFAFLPPEDFYACPDGYCGSVGAAFDDYEKNFIAVFAPFDITTTISLAPGGVTTASASFAGTITGVPEPTSWALLIAGFGIVGCVMRRRASATKPLSIQV